MRSKNTENSIVELDHKMANYQRKRYVVMKFIHEEKYIVFNSIGMNRRKKELYDGVSVLLAIVV